SGLQLLDLSNNREVEML
uniref:Putative disease resistance protein PS10 (Fragments) n=1 Tax=Pinus strobus TaxID=3348 RepID=PS10_PINST|nr:RecName: Full=Putative disease resistance protein PS10; AltName: Full=TIR-NBS-LRR [Pinus strobus]